MPATAPRRAGIPDVDLLAEAIEVATGGHIPRFAALLAVAPSEVSRWLNGKRDLPPRVRRTCEAMLADPAVIRAYERVLTAGTPA